MIQAHTSENTTSGFVETVLPDFTDGQGNYEIKNLTINVLDRESGVAEKYIVQYDPAPGYTKVPSKTWHTLLTQVVVVVFK